MKVNAFKFTPLTQWYLINETKFACFLACTLQAFDEISGDHNPTVTAGSEVASVNFEKFLSSSRGHHDSRLASSPTVTSESESWFTPTRRRIASSASPEFIRQTDIGSPTSAIPAAALLSSSPESITASSSIQRGDRRDVKQIMLRSGSMIVQQGTGKRTLAGSCDALLGQQPNLGLFQKPPSIMLTPVIAAPLLFEGLAFAFAAGKLAQDSVKSSVLRYGGSIVPLLEAVQLCAKGESLFSF